MPNVPKQPKIDQIVWFENHIPLWAATPASFGTTAATVEAVQEAVKAARDAYDAAQAARQAAKNATVEQDQMVRTMLTQGRDIVNTMKAFIENSGNAALWGQAGLEPDAPRGTAPAPNAPYMLSSSLDSQGNVIVKWKTSQPQGVSGVIYSVRRAIDGGAFVLLDSVGEKEFVDESVPYGTQSVTYAVKSKRGPQSSGWSESLTIRFGRIPGGGFVISSTETRPAKLAA